MRFRITIFIFLFLGITSQSQNVIDYYANGQVKFLGHLREGVKHGKWTEWNGNGDTVSIINYFFGYKNGPFKIWKLERPDGQLDTPGDDYAQDIGTILKYVGTYSGDVLNGRYEVFYPNGNLKSAGFYKKGQMDGTWVEYGENFDTTSIIKWRVGHKEGPFTIWDTYTNDPLAINSKSEVPLKHQGAFKNGILNGNYVVWHANGLLRSIGAYREGQKYGTWTFYRDNGTLEKEVEFKLDRIIKTIHYDEEGNPLNN